jgi:hypothetical protein
MKLTRVAESVSVSGDIRTHPRSSRAERRGDDAPALRQAQAARRKADRGAYRIEHGLQRDERIFTIVAPSGARLYSFADWTSAQAEAAKLNRT